MQVRPEAGRWKVYAADSLSNLPSSDTSCSRKVTETSVSAPAAVAEAVFDRFSRQAVLISRGRKQADNKPNICNFNSDYMTSVTLRDALIKLKL